MQPLKQLVSQSLNKHAGIKQAVEASLVIEAATEIITRIFGSEIGREIKPLYIKNRTLTVSCPNSTMAQELKLHETEILGELTTTLKEQAVDRIRYFA